MVKDWSPFKDEIRDLYLIQDRQLPEVVKVMKDKHNFVASQRSYCTQLRIWGFNKYSIQTNPKPQCGNRSAVHSSRRRSSTAKIVVPYPFSEINDSEITDRTMISIISDHLTTFAPALNTTPAVVFDLHGRDHEGKTRLHCAVIAQAVEQVRTLLDAGVAVNTSDITGNMPLHYAVSANSLAMVRLLIDFGADPNTKGYLERSPLHLAAGSPVLIKALLEAGAEHYSQDTRGDTPLHLTVSFASPETDISDAAYILLQAGCDVNMPNKAGETPFHQLLDKISYTPDDTSNVLAVMPNNNAVLKMILSFFNYGADPLIPCVNLQSPTQRFLSKFSSKKIFSRHCDRLWGTEVLRCFLDKGGSYLTKVESDMTLVSYYFRVGSETSSYSDFDQTFAQLFCNLVDPNQELTDGYTILHELVLCARNPQKWVGCDINGLISQALSHGALPNSRNDQGQTPLMLLFTSSGDITHIVRDVMVTLLRNGASPWSQDLKGDCPVYEAIRMFDKQLLTEERLKLRPVLVDDMLQADLEACNGDITREWQGWESAMETSQWVEAKQVILARNDELPVDVIYKLRLSALAVLAQKHLRLTKDKFKNQPDMVEHQRKLYATILTDCRSYGIEMDEQHYDYLLKLCV